MLRKGKISDAKALAKIHFLELHSDFLASLGEKFLSLLYVSLFQSKNTCVWVISLNNQVQGFVVGSNDFTADFKRIIVRNFFRYVLLIAPQLLKKPKILKNIIETLFYTKKEGTNKTNSELIAIAILKKYHRKGFGKKLVGALERSLLSQGIKEYKVTVNATNSTANSFYKSLDFKKNHDFFLYGKKINLYIKHIK